MSRGKFTTQWFKICLNAVLFIIWSAVLSAQCNQAATVIPAGKGGCDVWIKLADGTVFQPTNKIDKLREGQEINFSYTLDAPVTACTGAEAININCLNIVKETIVCKSKFEASLVGVDTAGHVTLKFKNLSYGNYKDVELNFGDGGFRTDFNGEINYTYTKPGLYEACLIVSSETCSSESCQYLMAGSNDLICSNSDCVYPGDANKDGKANLYDLLMIGVGNNKTGPARPDLTTDFNPKAAANWAFSTSRGVNYKHFDCDGNGKISNIDLATINTNYSRCEKPKVPIVAGSPQVKIVFEKDSIGVERSGGKIAINARIEVIGDPKIQIPIYGVAAYFKYNKNQVDNFIVRYNDGSFLGNEDNVLWDYKDSNINNTDISQVDFAVAKKSGKATKESGTIGYVTSIVDADIIMKANHGTSGQFEVEIEGGMVIDDFGNEYQITKSFEKSSVTLYDVELTTEINDLNSEIKLQVYPNPATEDVKFFLPNARASKLEFYNALGGSISTYTLSNVQYYTLPVTQLTPGVYVCKFTTNKGVAIKHLVVK